MATIFLITNVITIILLIIVITNRKEKKGISVPSGEEVETNRSHRGIGYKITECTNYFDETDVYYTLGIERVGYPGQWHIADPDGNEYSDNVMEAGYQKYKSIEEAKSDAVFRIDNNIKRYMEYKNKTYKSREV